MTAPKRRWFRFGLRTMFVVVTVFACWLGYQLNWIRQRHAFLARKDIIVQHSSAYYPYDAPTSLRVFGESGQAVLNVIIVDDVRAASCPNFGDRMKLLTSREAADVETAARLFPEATSVAGMILSHEESEDFKPAP